MVKKPLIRPYAGWLAMIISVCSAKREPSRVSIQDNFFIHFQMTRNDLLGQAYIPSESRLPRLDWGRILRVVIIVWCLNIPIKYEAINYVNQIVMISKILPTYPCKIPRTLHKQFWRNFFLCRINGEVFGAHLPRGPCGHSIIDDWDSCIPKYM